MAILGAENDIGFALLLSLLFISMLWVTTGLKTYVVLGMGLFAEACTSPRGSSRRCTCVSPTGLNPWGACATQGIHQTCQLAWGQYSSPPAA